MLDATSLAHESYLRFVQAGELWGEDRRAFFAYASQVMRSVILSGVRERQAEFGGYGAKEIAERFEVSEKTVERDWESARLILLEALW